MQVQVLRYIIMIGFGYLMGSIPVGYLVSGSHKALMCADMAVDAPEAPMSGVPPALSQLS